MSIIAQRERTPMYLLPYSGIGSLSMLSLTHPRLQSPRGRKLFLITRRSISQEARPSSPRVWLISKGKWRKIPRECVWARGQLEADLCSDAWELASFPFPLTSLRGIRTTMRRRSHDTTASSRTQGSVGAQIPWWPRAPKLQRFPANEQKRRRESEREAEHQLQLRLRLHGRGV